jgi:mRNA interferase MazF
MRRCEIYLVDLNNQVGSEQSGFRPALIVQNEKGNLYSPTTIICPLTTQSKHILSTHVFLTPAECGIEKDSIVLCEQIRVVDKSRLKRKIGEIINKEKIEDVNKKLMASIGILN